MKSRGALARCAARGLLLVCVASLIAGCAGTGPAPAATPPESIDAPPDDPVDRGALERLPDPVPVVEAPSATGNSSPYVVFGKRYEVLPDGSGYRADGRASWYGRKFHGRRTSSGEKFDMYALTGAHRSLPIPCYARITNLANGRSTIVRLNDRGPFHAGRLVDLSYAAAVKLGFDQAGTSWVRVEALTEVGEDGTAVAAAGSPPPSAANAVRYFVQVGAFRSRAAAEALERRIARVAAGATARSQRGADGVYRVRVGPLPNRTAADRLQSLLIGAALGAAFILSE